MSKSAQVDANATQQTAIEQSHSKKATPPSESFEFGYTAAKDFMAEMTAQEAEMFIRDSEDPAWRPTAHPLWDVFQAWIADEGFDPAEALRGLIAGVRVLQNEA